MVIYYKGARYTGTAKPHSSTGYTGGTSNQERKKSGGSSKKKKYAETPGEILSPALKEKFNVVEDKEKKELRIYGRAKKAQELKEQYTEQPGQIRKDAPTGHIDPKTGKVVIDSNTNKYIVTRQETKPRVNYNPFYWASNPAYRESKKKFYGTITNWGEKKADELGQKLSKTRAKEGSGLKTYGLKWGMAGAGAVAGTSAFVSNLPMSLVPPVKPSAYQELGLQLKQDPYTTGGKIAGPILFTYGVTKGVGKGIQLLQKQRPGMVYSTETPQTKGFKDTTTTMADVKGQIEVKPLIGKQKLYEFGGTKKAFSYDVMGEPGIKATGERSTVKIFQSIDSAGKVTKLKNPIEYTIESKGYQSPESAVRFTVTSGGKLKPTYSFTGARYQDGVLKTKSVNVVLGDPIKAKYPKYAGEYTSQTIDFLDLSKLKESGEIPEFYMKGDKIKRVPDYIKAEKIVGAEKPVTRFTELRDSFNAGKSKVVEKAKQFTKSQTGRLGPDPLLKISIGAGKAKLKFTETIKGPLPSRFSTLGERFISDLGTPKIGSRPFLWGYVPNTGKAQSSFMQTSTISRTGLGKPVPPLEKPILKLDPIMTPITETIPQTIPDTISKTSQKSTSKPSPVPPIGNTPIITSPPIILTPVPDFYGGQGSQKKSYGKAGKARTKYAPSITAIFGKITGKKPKGILTGLEVRPITNKRL